MRSVVMTDYRPSAGCPPDHALHVFVLEDNLELREHFLLPLLRDHGFRAQGAATAAAFYRAMHAQRFDILILDLGLPGEDGFAVAQHLRAISSIGIVILTGHNERQRHLDALKYGADCFLTKPVDIDLLITTLHALARRISAPHIRDEAAPVPRTDRWWLVDHGWRLISPHGKTVLLSAAEQCLVITLVNEGGIPVPREVLIRALTRNVDDFDPHRLDMMIHRLRRKVLESTGETLPLITVRGNGYLLACDSDASVSSS
jgi:two-component system, OmpR family, response regulator PhoP